MNTKNSHLYLKYYEEHLQEGGTMPVEVGLTNVVRDCLLNKDYKIHKKDDHSTIKEWDVVMYTNWVNDVFFGVCTEKDGNVLYVNTGTSDGVVTKVLEG